MMGVPLNSMLCAYATRVYGPLTVTCLNSPISGIETSSETNEFIKMTLSTSLKEDFCRPASASMGQRSSSWALPTRRTSTTPGSRPPSKSSRNLQTLGPACESTIRLSPRLRRKPGFLCRLGALRRRLPVRSVRSSS